MGLRLGYLLALHRLALLLQALLLLLLPHRLALFEHLGLLL